MLGVSVEHDAVAVKSLKRLPEVIAKHADVRHRREIHGACAGFAESRRHQHTLSTGPYAALVSSTMNQRFQRRASTNVERADSLGRIELVADDAEHVHAELVHACRDLPD